MWTKFLSSVTNNSNNSYDISDLVWLNQNSRAEIMVAPPVQEWTPPFQTEATCHMTPSAHSLFLLAARLFRRGFAREGNCFVKLQSSLEFACYCFQIRFITTLSFIGYISWCFLLWITSL